MRSVATTLWIGAGLLVVAGTLACGSRERASKEVPGHDDAGPPTVTPPEPLIERSLGVASLADFAYSRGPGRKAFKRAVAAERGGDWATVEAQTRAALALDPGHLEAHWLHARALVHLGRHAEVGADLVAAVAGDWLRWGPHALDNPGFEAYRATPQGALLSALVERYGERMRVVARDGLWLIGRRGKAWRPRETGAVSVNHRAEVYAYDLEQQRYVRLSRTNGTAVAFLRSPAGNAAAYVAYRKAWLPADAERAAGRVPYVRELAIGTIDAAGPRMSEREAVLADVRAIEQWYATSLPGEPGRGVDAAAPALVARVWGVDGAGAPHGKPRLYLIDAEAGQARPLARAPNDTDVLRVGYGRASVRRPRVAGVAADWDRGGAAGAFMLSDTRRTITLPEGDSAARDSLRWSARRSRLAFSTQPADPCGEQPADRQAVLYVVDASTGKLQELARGEHDFAPVWLDDARLAYTAAPARGDGGVRVYDAEAGREAIALDVLGGAGTQWLPAPSRCDTAPFELGPDDADGVPDASDEWDDEWDDDDGLGASADAGATERPAAPAEAAR